MLSLMSFLAFREAFLASCLPTFFTSSSFAVSVSSSTPPSHLSANSLSSSTTFERVAMLAEVLQRSPSDPCSCSG